MSRLALRSLLSHPLRTALTTLAILLGVAMISGTYVLTDQISNAFDGIFSTAYEGTAVVVTPKNAVGGFDDESAVLTMPDSLLAEARAVDGVASAAGGAEAMGAVVVDGELVKTSGAPTLVMSTEDAALEQRRLDGRRRAGAGRRGRRRRRLRREARRVRRRRDRPRDPARHRARDGERHLHLRRQLVAGRHHHGRRRARRRAALVRHARRAHVDQPHGGAGSDAEGARRAHAGGAARLARGQDRDAGRRRQLGRGRGLHQLVPAPGPARLRRRGRLRRRLHHLQRLLDHHRPAAARVRHAACLRRLAAPGADLGHRRGAAPGRDRVGRRSVRRPRRGQGHQPAVQGLRRRLPGRRSRPRAAHRRGGARRRHRHGARRRRRAGGPRHADPAGGGAPGGRDAAGVAVSAASRPRARSSSPCSAPAS